MEQETTKIILEVALIALLALFLTSQYYIRKKFFRKNLTESNSWMEKKFFLVLFFPKDYLSKKKLSLGYFLYLLSLLLLVLILITFHFLLKVIN